MTRLVDPDEIEKIVGVQRHPTEHWARAVSAVRKVYVLHSQECRDSGTDLRECEFSLAMDRGIEPGDWDGVEDTAVRVLIDDGGVLVPDREEDPGA
jgi:hypothetical protein